MREADLTGTRCDGAVLRRCDLSGAHCARPTSTVRPARLGPVGDRSVVGQPAGAIITWDQAAVLATRWASTSAPTSRHRSEAGQQLGDVVTGRSHTMPRQT